MLLMVYIIIHTSSTPRPTIKSTITPLSSPVNDRCLDACQLSLTTTISRRCEPSQPWSSKPCEHRKHIQTP
ncbi:uncharacterized protein BJ212DRAFT_1374070 [Suillus subaureus]|uniref:Uncharacterized protein n=1 Tax=Suillus subaureus TaxID=48587 RepID=A0A9P7DW49_9AGAM|nr:uncharacterized protein BJ212DRAFT_1393681 [Suillus subaureus]XP_041189978.1 uncharacterized protein BJ212DRAFT_1374070 [Suillus subaureus]KAG1804549.1 hypothetical protein BJ212DRAFT_1393681 [Suillus subaureus]KAG1811379.1 hypothetical protein BJ212DRAFT_1374070 [Suillus subaureus]